MNPSLPRISEKQFMEQVVDYAHFRGWLHYHPFDSRRSPAGFPDLLLLRSERILVIELKREGYHPTDSQWKWLIAFRVAGVQTKIWRPSDWKEIEIVLR